MAKNHLVNWGKIIVSAVAILFFIYGLFLSTLWLLGTASPANIKTFRRELGERNETIRNSYTYSYSYEFTASGKAYSGNSKKVQGPVFLQNSGNSFIMIHYLKCCPRINAPESDFNPKYKLLIYFSISAILAYFARKMI